MLESIHGPLASVLRQDDIIVADHLAAHKANKVAEALQEYEADIWLLPPDSPDLNPIERLWSKLKTSLRHAQATTVQTLRQAARRALETITKTDIRGWISHSHYLQIA